MSIYEEEQPYLLPEMIVTPDDDTAPEVQELKKRLAERIAARIAEEEEGTGSRSGLRDLINADGELGPTYASQEIPSDIPRITVTPGTTTNVPAGPLPRMDDAPQGMDLTQDEAPNYEGTIPDLTGVFASPDPEQIQPSPTLDFLDRSTRGVRQMARGTLSAAGALPWTLGAALTAPVAYGARKMGFEGPAQVTDWFLEKADVNRRFADEVTGLSGEAAKPQNVVEELANLAGESLMPAGKATVPITAALTATQFGMKHALGPAEAASKAQTERAAQKKAEKDRQNKALAETVVETIGGPAKVQNSELGILGGLVLATAGMIFAPKVFSKFKAGGVPKLRSVENAEPTTVAMSNTIDYARATGDDINAGALRLARRAGVNPQVMSDIEKTFTIQTRANAHALVDSAVQIGRMETPGFTFQAKVPLAVLARQETPQLQQYLHLRDTFDDLLLQKVQPGATAGPPRVRGMTDQDVLRELGALERAHPELKQLGAAYRDNVKAMRTFMSKGEYATISTKELRFLNSQRQNTVPFDGKRVMGEPVERGSPTQSLADYMHTALRKRMENEAVGQYVDAMRKIEPRSFVRVTHKQLTDNPHWRQNTVTIHRRGKPEHYTTDPFLADVLKMDPYYFTSTSGQLLYGTKRLLEMGATGKLAPWFAVTSALRSWQISKFTTPAGLRSSTALGTLYAIPQQLVPQMAKAISQSLDRGSAGWLTQTFGQAQVNNLSARLANAYNQSLVAQMATVGTTRASVLEQQVIARTKLQQAAGAATGTGKAFLNGYDALLHAIHNAPMHNFAKRNVNRMTLPELAAAARHMTGSPKKGGQFFTKEGSSIRLEGTSRVTHTLAKGYGRATELARESVPWFNMTQQGIKRIGEAYLNDPARFVGRMYMYAMAPAAASYFGARSLGNDPNGMSYVDYMMNRRSDYAKQMFLYIPVPGKPAEEGIEFPLFHELAPAARLMQVALDHATHSSIFKESEDFMKAANSFMHTALIPPMPPIINVGFATQGIVGPQGVFGGEAYKRRQDPFDQTGGMSANLEIMTKALGGGIADVLGVGYAAYTQTPDGFMSALGNAAKESGKRAVSKAPLIRDVANVHAPMSGNNPVTEELFKKQRFIDQLLRYIGGTADKNAKGQISNVFGTPKVNTKAASGAGGQIAEKLLGEVLPSEMAGIQSPNPTNPLYVQFAETFYNKFKKDTPNEEGTGGIGIRSLWRRYGDATSHLRSLRNINAGNFVTWQQQLAERPEQLARLQKENVDYKNPLAVRNYYEKVRQDAGRAILFAIRSVEHDMSKQLGRPVKLEDLDPYGKGGSAGEDMTATTPLEFEPAVMP